MTDNGSISPTSLMLETIYLYLRVLMTPSGSFFAGQQLVQRNLVGVQYLLQLGKRREEADCMARVPIGGQMLVLTALWLAVLVMRRVYKSWSRSMPLAPYMTILIP
jgi:hypothetical protein